MPKLRIPVGMILSFLQLAITLQAVVLLVKELRDSDIADRMMLLAEFGGERPRAFADPPQRRFRIATGSAVNQAVQCDQQGGIGRREVLASCTRATKASFQRGVSCFDFANTFADCLAGQTTSTVNQ